MQNHSFKRVLSTFLIFSFIYPAFAITLRLKTSRNIRERSVDNILVADKHLPAGTVLIIPDEFVDKNFKGDKRDEVAILNWLSSSVNIPLLKFDRGSSKVGREFFVPVIEKESGEKGWVSLRSLAKSDKIEVVNEDTPTEVELETVESTPWMDPSTLNSRDEFNNWISQFENLCRGRYENEELEFIYGFSDDTAKIIDNLIGEIHDTSKTAFHNRDDSQRIIENFQKTCAPMSFDTFYNEAKKYAYEERVPLDLLLGIMTQESSGNCGAVNNERNSTKSVGLFQINTGSSTVKSCGFSKENLFKKDCLENPITNLKEGIKILRSKYASVNDDHPPKISTTKKNAIFNDLAPLIQDKWRKAISAYNGGEAHVFQAYRDIAKFNELYEENLNPENWEIRRLFMLRKAIERKSGKIFDRQIAYRKSRNPDLTIHNLAYVEAIVSSDSSDSDDTQGNKWTSFVLKH